MKKGFFSRFAVACFTVLAVWGWSGQASATHFRHGTINWRTPDPDDLPSRVEFTVTTSWRSAFIGTTNLNFGDGTSNGSVLGSTIGTGVDNNGNPYTTTQYVVTHDYASEGEYTAFFDSCCRVEGLVNGDEQGFRVETTVGLGGGNTAPLATASTAIVQFERGAVRTHDFLMFDADGDPVSCRFATAAESGLNLGDEVPAVPADGSQPSVSAPSPNQCRVTWDLTNAVGGEQYVLHVVLESTHGSPPLASKTALDVLVEITSEPVPTCPTGGVFSLPIGTPFSQVLSAADPGNDLTLSAIGQPAGSTFTPGTGTTAASPVSTTFDWTPGAASSGTTEFMLVNFTNPQNITGTCPLVLFVEPVCGNTDREVGEACDDGNTLPGDGCSANCLLEDDQGCTNDGECESGVCDLTEAIPVCEPADTCGNSKVETGEGCDDGATTAGDGCDATCLLEDGGACATDTDCASGVCDLNEAPPVCEAADVCGNGAVEAGEGCDDGGTTAGDGCTAACSKELGETCGASAECESGVCDALGSSTCEPADTCGNGSVEAGEICDDGNVTGGDGCNASCFLEEGSACTLGAQCATGVCDVGGFGCVVCLDDQVGGAMDTGCGGVAAYCDASGVFPACIAGCADDGPGAADPGCSGGDSACDLSGSNPVCVDCTDTADCSVGDACSSADNTCVAGCFDDTDCRTPEASVCDTSASTPGACVACVNDQGGATPDEGCGDPLLPVCNGASGAAGTACVFCVDDMSGAGMDAGCTSLGAALCDTSVLGGACVECLSDDDCPGLQVCTGAQACDYPDSDGDGLTDVVDLDDDADGIPDDEEGGGTDWSLDDDGDGVPDYADPDSVTCSDTEPDGICDSLPPEVDLDGDGVANHLDLDSDGDGVPDSIEGHDADGDGLADAVPSGNDADGDGLDDAFDADCSGLPAACTADGLPAAVQDMDGDGAPDYLDADSDNDGLLDRVEAFDGNGDGTPEAVPSGIDADGNGLDDAFDLAQGGIGTTGQDPDGDGRPDYLDADSDGDGIADRVECPDPTGCVDTDGDGAPDALDSDADGDGVPDAIEGHDGNADGAPDFLPLGFDDDADGLDDAYDIDMAGGVPATTPDRDGDGTPDFQDPDDDGDGVWSAFECVDVMAGCPDADGDGAPDYLDADQSPIDTDGDGIPDAVECDGVVASCRDTDGNGTADHLDPDDDGDGIPTEVECTTDPSACDSDADGLPDHRDIDSDGDGIVDSVECEGTPVCEDTDVDGAPDYLDSDADADGIADSVEGHDADMNGVPDAIALGADSDGDGLDDAFDDDDGGTVASLQNTDADFVPDFRDPDDDGDGVDTVFECADPGAGCPDADADFAPDYLDADSTVADTDGDGIPDVVECPPPGDPVGDPLNCPDTDGDGSPDFNDPDDDDDGVDTAVENYDGDNDPTDQDSDADGTPDYLDTDDDGDGVLTTGECADFAARCPDSDGDGRPDYLDVCGDDTVSVIDVGSGWEECDDGNAVDGDGCDSSCRRETDVADTDGDGLLDDVECPPPGSPLQPSSCPDTDGDGDPDFDDGDDDNDGIDTVDESPDGDSDPSDDDTDGDGVPNYLDEDDDGDGIPTAEEIAASSEVENNDVDGDGDPNWLDTDSDGDEIDDADEPGDADENGVPDYLEVVGASGGEPRWILQGTSRISCHVGRIDESSASTLLLMLALCLGIRRYRRN